MPDLPSVTTFINSPPGQLVAGAALAGIVWKFFERVEAVLTDQTKFEIAVWLVGTKTTEKAQKWSVVLAALFSRTVGPKHFSWKCISRSTAASTLGITAASVVALPPLVGRPNSFSWHWIVILWIGVVISDYISLFITRLFFRAICIHPTRAAALLIGDFVVSAAFAWFFFDLWGSFYYSLKGYWVGTINLPVDLYKDMIVSFFATFMWKIHEPTSLALIVPGDVGRTVNMKVAFCISSVITSIPLWLYAASGFLLKFARRFDLGFDWFNRKFDIEKKPLSAIGLVASSLVAILYWTWAVIRHFYPA